MKLFGGQNYTFNGTTVTPAANFSGALTVQVSVNDGEAESNQFGLKIEVLKPANQAPQITGQSPLSIKQGESIAIAFDHLKVTDPDDTYPNGFTLKLYGGQNYTFSGTTVTPSADFSGMLTVPVSVNDGGAESNKYNLKIEVIEKPNQSPKITGQTPLTMKQGESITVAFEHLKVTDPDNTYPNGFTLKLYEGANYSLKQSTVTPNADFFGSLTVGISVNDGKSESNKFNLKIDVAKLENKAPIIVGQATVSTNEDEPFTVLLTHLKVTDEDSNYPQEFTLFVDAGTNYSVDANTVIPTKDFFGILSIPMRVTDGKTESAPYLFQLNVLPVNDPPIITGQAALSMDMNTTLELQLSDLTIRDPDTKNSSDFKILISKGDNYTFAAETIIPAPAFSGVLHVIVALNDGTDTGPEFKLKVNVVAPEPNKPPVITGQKPISLTPNGSLQIFLSHLIVTDADDEYPYGFTLKLFNGEGYTLSGSRVTLNPDISDGVVTVPVVVNDGEDDSAPFDLKIQVVPITQKPRIVGHRELSVAEDSTIVLTLADLVVADADNLNYPQNFILIVLPDNKGRYTRQGNEITPALNLNGFIDVGVIVSDGTNASDEFHVIILVKPVNDAPEIAMLDTASLEYRPGEEAIILSEKLYITDIDNNDLIMAEIGFLPNNYNPRNDMILMPDGETHLRTVQDSDGRLFFIGHGSLEDYEKALKSLKYYYRVTEDFAGNPDEILSGPRTIYMTLFDGQANSLPCKRRIVMQVEFELDIPNAFTPNGDQANDTWNIKVTNSDRVEQAVIRVYDRRGSVIYESIGFDAPWNGMSNGQLVPMDTYYYTIDLNLSYIKKTYKGAVSILH